MIPHVILYSAADIIDNTSLMLRPFQLMGYYKVEFPSCRLLCVHTCMDNTECLVQNMCTLASVLIVCLWRVVRKQTAMNIVFAPVDLTSPRKLDRT